MSLFSLFRARHRSELSRRPAVANRSPRSKPGVELLENRLVMSIYGDPNNPGALPTQINDAYYAGDRTIVINTGTYVMPSNLYIQGWHDATISAYNVTFHLQDTKSNSPGIALINCTNVTVKGPTVIWDKIPFTQGRVINVGVDSSNHSYADWKIDAGYPNDPKDINYASGLNAVDANTRMLKGTGDSYNPPHQALGNDTYRLSLPAGFVAVNDWLVARDSGVQHTFYLRSCTNCTVQDATLEHGSYGAIYEEVCSGDHFLHDTITLGARPAGATTDPVVANAADGLDAAWDRIGPDIENCVFNGIFLDDIIAIRGRYQHVNSAAGNTLTVVQDPYYPNLVVGEPAVVSDRNGFYAQANVTKIELVQGTNTELVTLDKPLAATPGSFINNPLQDGAGYKIINNTLSDTRSRGIIVKGGDGLIQGNTITHCGQGISIGPEANWDEAGYVHNVRVLNNTILDTFQYGILVHGDGAVGNADITIQGNVFDGNHGTEMWVGDAANVVIAGNTMINNTDTNANDAAVELWNTRNVTLSDNIVGPGAVARPLLTTSHGTLGTQGLANGVFATGTYQVSNLNSRLWLSDPNGGGLGTGQDLENYSGGLGQRWIFAAVPGSPGKVTITNAANGLVLGVKGSTAQGTQLDLEAPNGSSGQLWSIVDDASDASVRFVNGLTGFTADVGGNPTTVGTPVIESPANGRASQSWQLTPPVPVPPGTYQIVNLNSGLVLADPKGGGVGTNQDQEIYTGALSQQWLIAVVPVVPIMVTITNAANGLVLGVRGSTAQGIPLDLETPDGSVGQLWSLVDDASHTSLRLVNGLTGFVADVSAGSKYPGAAVTDYPNSGGANQSWMLIATVASAAKADSAPVTAATTVLSALGVNDTGNLKYTWSTTGTPPASVTFSANGTNTSKSVTATFTKAGTYNFQVAIVDQSGHSTISVVSVVVQQTVTSLTLSPANSPGFAVGGTLQVVATAVDQFGNAMTVPTLTWPVSSGPGTVSNTGLYTATANGTATVAATATVGAKTITSTVATIAVSPPPVSPPPLSPPSVSPPPVGPPSVPPPPVSPAPVAPPPTSIPGIFVIGADAGGTPRVQVFTFDSAGNRVLSASFLAFPAGFTGGVRVAVGDLHGDGIQDLVVAAGPGGGSQIKVIDGSKLSQLDATGMISDSALLGDFFAYRTDFTGGTFVALGHFHTGPGLDLLIGAGPGGGPHVRAVDGSRPFQTQQNAGIFTNVLAEQTLLANFFAYLPSVSTGIAVAAGDLNGDGIDEVITGSGPGVGFAPHVKVIDGRQLHATDAGGSILPAALLTNFYAYDTSFSGGVFVAAGDLNGDGKAELVTGTGIGGTPVVKVYNPDFSVLTQFSAASTTSTVSGGVRVGLVSTKGRIKIVTGQGPGPATETQIYDVSVDPMTSVTTVSSRPSDDFFAFGPGFNGGEFIG